MSWPTTFNAQAITLHEPTDNFHFSPSTDARSLTLFRIILQPKNRAAIACLPFSLYSQGNQNHTFASMPKLVLGLQYDSVHSRRLYDISRSSRYGDANIREYAAKFIVSLMASLGQPDTISQKFLPARSLCVCPHSSRCAFVNSFSLSFILRYCATIRND